MHFQPCDQHFSNDKIYKKSLTLLSCLRKSKRPDNIILSSIYLITIWATNHFVPWCFSSLTSSVSVYLSFCIFNCLLVCLSRYLFLSLCVFFSSLSMCQYVCLLIWLPVRLSFCFSLWCYLVLMMDIVIVTQEKKPLILFGDARLLMTYNCNSQIFWTEAITQCRHFNVTAANVFDGCKW